MQVGASVRHAVDGIARGTVFTSAQLLHCGSRAGVDQTLSRLVRDGTLKRVRRGLYVRPRVSRVAGEAPVSIEDVVRAVVTVTGETTMVHGATAANALGLSGQVPLQHVYLTSGKSRVLYVGRTGVRFQHTSSRWLTLAGTQAGLAATALRYMGEGAVNEEIIDRVRRKIGDAQFALLCSTPRAVPAWLRSVLDSFERSRRAR